MTAKGAIINAAMSESFFSIDARERPLYPVAQAARLIGVPAPTIRSWVSGRKYPRRDGEAALPALITAPPDEVKRLSFWNLLELQALRALRTLGTGDEVKVPAVREALNVAQSKYKIDRLLVHEGLRTFAGKLFLEHYGSLTSLTRSDQVTLLGSWSELAKRIDFGKDGLGFRLRPRLNDAPDLNVVVIDPAVAFGRPTLKGVRTDVLRARLDAGEEIEEVAADFNLDREEVVQAIRFDRLAA